MKFTITDLRYSHLITHYVLRITFLCLSIIAGLATNTSRSQPVPVGASGASYLITNAMYGWMDIPVYSNATLSIGGALVYTNLATNGSAVFLAYGDPRLSLIGYQAWDISTAYPDTNSVHVYINLSSARSRNGDFTNVFGRVWGASTSVQVLAPQPKPLYRLFMFSPAPIYTNMVVAFDGNSPTNVIPLFSPIFTDTSHGVNNTIRDVCHMRYVDDTGRLTYLMSWSHYGVGQGAGLASSPDDTNYTFLGYLAFSLSPAFSNQCCWSPKIFVNATNGLEITTLLGPTNIEAVPTNTFISELDPVNFTRVSGTRLLALDGYVGGVAALYHAGAYYIFGGSGVVYTNLTLASSGWKACWTNSATMVGGTLTSHNGLYYWFGTYPSITYSTATNYAGPWSAPAAMPFPGSYDLGEGDGSFIEFDGTGWNDAPFDQR